MGLRLRLLLPYVILIVLSIVGAFFTYGQIVRIVAERKAADSLSILERGIENLESKIEVLKLNQYAVLSSPNLQVIKNMRQPFSGSLVIDLSDFRDDLFLIDGGEREQEILDLGIFFLSNATVINRSGIYKAGEFYPNFFRYGDMSYQEWSSFIAFNEFRYHITPQRTFVLNGRRYLGNLLIHSVRTTDISGETVVCYYLDNLFFVEPFEDLTIQAGGSIYAVDTEGRHIFGDSDGTFDRDTITDSDGYSRDGDRIVTYAPSSAYDWTVVYDQSYRLLFSDIFVIRNYSIAFSIIYLLLTVIVSFYFYRHNYGLFEDLVVLLKGTPPDGKKGPDVYKLIRDGLVQLQEQNRSLSAHEREQSLLLKDYFFASLLDGSNTLWEDSLVRDFAARSPGTQTYSVSLVKVAREGSGFDGAPLVYLSRHLGSAVGSALYSMQKSGYLVTIHSSPLADLAEVVRGVVSELASLRALTDHQDSQYFFAAVGDPVASLTEISRSYHQARQRITYNIANGRPGVHAHTPDDSDYEFLNVDTQLAVLSSAIVSNDTARIEQCFDSWKALLLDDSHMLADRQFCLTNLYYSIQKTLRGLVVESEIEPLDPSFFTRIGDLSEAITSLDSCRRQSLAASAALDARRSSHNRGLFEKIKEYIHRELCEQGLCASRIADEFEISELYFYHFFKEQAGTTFADYLENLRLTYARELLAGPLKIKDVAEECGYASSTAFGRAFKRKWGITAGEFRETAQRS